MDHPSSQPVKRYYEILGVSADAPPGAIRTAYKRLAMKCHPDKCNLKDRAEAKRSFQDIQEAYTVLSDLKKKALYDCGLYNPKDDDADVEGLSSFLDEMTSMMGRVQTSQDMGAGSSLEDLQSLFLSMFSSDLASLSKPCPSSSMNFDKKRSWQNSDFDSSYVGSCFMGQTFSSPLQTQYFVNENFYVESNSNGTSKKVKCAAGGMSSSACDMGVRNEGSKIRAGFYASRGASLFNMKMHDAQYDGSTA